MIRKQETFLCASERLRFTSFVMDGRNSMVASCDESKYCIISNDDTPTFLANSNLTS